MNFKALVTERVPVNISLSLVREHILFGKRTRSLIGCIAMNFKALITERVQPINISLWYDNTFLLEREHVLC
jgi:hypothetical protein